MIVRFCNSFSSIIRIRDFVISVRFTLGFPSFGGRYGFGLYLKSILNKVIPIDLCLALLYISSVNGSYLT